MQMERGQRAVKSTILVLLSFLKRSTVGCGSAWHLPLRLLTAVVSRAPEAEQWSRIGTGHLEAYST